jgi:phenylalanyl-tRNA synthetase beta chain
MIISVNWLKKYTDIDGSIDELATLIGARLVEIESVEDLGAKYKDVVVAQVVECAPLEGSDHLNVTKIDDGGVAQHVERDENGLVQVVCGAPNVRAGLLVAWLPPESVVPETFGTAEPFVLGAKALRGAMSNGMLASARELDLYDDHSGILELDKEAAPGTSFAQLYELDDYLLDIENKSLTHRPDTFGVIGFAREVAGIQGKPFSNPDWLTHLVADFSPSDALQTPSVQIEDTSLSDRFQAIVLSGVDETATSPIQLQTYLARSGVRPINASVDVSNYLMLLTGQPSHTYDYDKLRAVAGDDFTIRVRTARPSETLTLLDGKEVTLDEADIVIAAGDTAVGLAGIMGGKSTLVDETTRAVVLEVATFDLYHMRSSQMRHGIFSEAVTRFTKGIPAPLSSPVLNEAVKLLGSHAKASVASAVADAYPGQREPITVRINQVRINEILGTQFAAEDIAELLTNVGFEVVFEGLDATVTVPYWREDIHLPEDITEEIGRLAGYDTIQITLPRRDFTAVRPSAFDELRSNIRTTLARAGANEVLTYSFVHGDLLQKVGQDTNDAYRITNSISPDLQYYRQSLTPSLLTHVHPNSKAGYGSFALFECNKVHQKSFGTNEEAVPVEIDRVALVLSDTKAKGAAYYSAKRQLEYLMGQLGIAVDFVPLVAQDSLAKPFEIKRSATVLNATTGEVIGVVGEYTRAVQKNFKLPSFTAGFEIDPRALLRAVESLGTTYAPLSRFPGTERDICFQVATTVPYAEIVTAANEAVQQTGLITNIEPVDIYQAEGADTKNVTIRITLASYEKTLTADEANEVVNQLIKQVTETTEGKVV